MNKVEPSDYYFENGALVFTESYHVKRGYCCGSGCRHCPWNVEESSKRDSEHDPNPETK